MNELIKFFDEYVKNVRPFRLEIEYTKGTDWSIRIIDYYLNEVFNENHVDVEYLAAKAHVALKDWLLDKYDGY